MAPLKAGDKFPADVKFDWAPALDDDSVCGRPQEFDASKEFKGKKIVLVSVPDTKTNVCISHLPPFGKKIGELKSKGVDFVVVIANNDAFVMNGWSKANKITGDDIRLMSDTKTFFSKNYGWDAGMGDRNGRWAMIIEKDGTVSYAENEKSPAEVTVSGADAILAKL
ncbi:hypothetical protein MBLNU459_g2958t1 [Dothideomycetes sp. NU459]